MAKRAGLHIDDRAALEAALTAMERDTRNSCWRWLPNEHRNQEQALSNTLEQAARAHAGVHAAEMTEDDLSFYEECNPVMGEAIYGAAGIRRYFLRYDGFVYYSAWHGLSGDEERARALGFRIN